MEPSPTTPRAPGALIDGRYRLVRELAKEGVDHVRYVDIRGTLSSRLPTRYLDDWNDELHPTRSGFELVADKIARAIQ